MMMKILSNISLLTIITGLIACSSPTGSGQQPQFNSDDGNGAVNSEPPRMEVPMQVDDVQKATKATIMDQTLNIPVCTINVPAGWLVHQQISSNPHGAGYLTFMLALESPEGVIHGFLPFTTEYTLMNFYGQVSGMDFDQLLPHLMRYCTQPFLEKYTLGPTVPDQEALMSEQGRGAVEGAQNLANQSISSGNPAQADAGIVDMMFTAFRNNVPYKGGIKAMKMGVIVQYDANSWGKYGMAMGLFTLAPEPLFDKAASVDLETLFQIQMNEEWDQMRIQIMQRGHQDRMVRQRQQIETHQSRMASMRRSFDEHNQGWYDRNFGPSGASSYSGNTAVLDAITGQTSFNDPYTGHQIKQSGHYDHWYTNEFGEYHGTNDPSFQPGAHYDGNWRPIQPVSVDH